MKKSQNNRYATVTILHTTQVYLNCSHPHLRVVLYISPLSIFYT